MSPRPSPTPSHPRPAPTGTDRPRDPGALLALVLAVSAVLAVVVVGIPFVPGVLLGAIALSVGLRARRRARTPGGDERAGHPADCRVAAVAVWVSATFVVGFAAMAAFIMVIFWLGGS